MRAGAWLLAVFVLTNVLIGSLGEGDDAEASSPSWAPLEDAVIRPGVQVTADGHGWCTANFVFTDDSGGIYIGTAAHCVHDSIGANVHLQSDPDYFTGEEGPVIGHVWYSARVYENVWSQPCVAIGPIELLSCSQGPGNSANDFALIKIYDAWHDKVHPAVQHFGGPTGLVPVSDIHVNDRILTYGNSPLRPGPTPLDWREGHVANINAPWLVHGCILTPGVPGDSGSGAMLGDGRAMGVVITLGVGFPCAVTNGITVLHTALAYASQRGYDVQLATWEQLNEGLLP